MVIGVMKFQQATLERVRARREQEEIEERLAADRAAAAAVGDETAPAANPGDVTPRSRPVALLSSPTPLKPSDAVDSAALPHGVPSSPIISPVRDSQI